MSEFEQSLASLLTVKIQAHGESLSEKMLADFTDDFRKRAKQLVAEAVLEIFHLAKFDMRERELVITVKLPEGK